MTFAGFLALLQSAGFLHMLFSTLSVLLPQATKEQPVYFVIRRIIDWAALNVGNAENLPKKGTLSPVYPPDSSSTQGFQNTPSPLQPLQPDPVVPVTDKQAGDGSDVPKFPN